jgi:mRNA-degrading endonuclease toxin of MazEF toxin-antitoxin module
MAVNFSKGDIVLVKFAFGLHPAYVLYDNGDLDLLVCMITSTQRSESEEVEIPQGECNIKNKSYIRTHKIASISKRNVGAAIIGKVSKSFAAKVARTMESWLNPA